MKQHEFLGTKNGLYDKRNWMLGILLAVLSQGSNGALPGDREGQEAEAEKVSGGSGSAYDTEGWYRCPTNDKGKLNTLKSLLDVYPKTKDLGITSITSTYTGTAPAPANHLSSHPAIHGVHYQDTFAFATTAPLDPKDPFDTTYDIYLKTPGKEPRLMSVPLAGKERTATGGGPSTEPALGQCTLAFTSASQNLDPRDTNTQNDIYFVDTCAAEAKPQLLSRSPTTNQSGNGASRKASVSDNGLCIAFASDASDLIKPADSTTSPVSAGIANLYLLTRKTLSDPWSDPILITKGTNDTGKPVAANDASGEVALDGNCTGLVFSSHANNLLAKASPGYPDSNNQADIYHYHITSGTITKVSHGYQKKDSGNDYREADGPSHQPAISEDGKWIAFASKATNLIEGDTNKVSDIFLTETPAKLSDPFPVATRISMESRTNCVSGPCYQAETTTDLATGKTIATIKDLTVGTKRTLVQSNEPSYLPSVSVKNLNAKEKVRVAYNTMSPSAVLPAPFYPRIDFPAATGLPSWETRDLDQQAIDRNTSPDVILASVRDDQTRLIPISIVAPLRISELRQEALANAKDLLGKQTMSDAYPEHPSGINRNGRDLTNYQIYQRTIDTTEALLSGKTTAPTQDTCKKILNPEGLGLYGNGAWQRASLKKDHTAYQSRYPEAPIPLLEDYLAAAFYCSLSPAGSGKAALLGNGWGPTYGIQYGNGGSEIETSKALQSNGITYRSAASNFDLPTHYTETTYCRDETDALGRSTTRQETLRQWQYRERNAPAIYHRSPKDLSGTIDGFEILNGASQLLQPSLF